MFRCEVCDSVAPPRTRCQRIIVETRAVSYPRRAEAHWHPPRAGGKGKWVDDPGGRGTEIVRELRVCELCAAKAAALERRGEPLPIEDRAESSSRNAGAALTPGRTAHPTAVEYV